MKKNHCPSLSPRCDGELKISETTPGGQLIGMDSNGEKIYSPWEAAPSAARCCKCGKRWTSEHLAVEGIEIRELPFA